MQIDFGGGSEIGFERKGKAGIVTLTRVSALNALTHNMILALDRALQAWETDPDVACVILEGEGRAFCRWRCGGSLQSRAGGYARF